MTTATFADLAGQLDRHAGHFLYKQIKSILREKMESQELKPGDAIPPQRELSKICKVSEVTVRRAIQELVQEGLLSSRAGSGTFVLEPNKNVRTPQITDTADVKVRSNDIGVAFANISEGYPLFDQWLAGIRSVMGDDCLLQLFEQPTSSDAAERAARLPLGQVAGLIMLTPINFKLTARCRAQGVPYVLCANMLDDAHSPQVVTDCETGITDAMVHLHDRGFDRIAYVSSGPHLWSTGQFVSGYRMGCKWLKQSCDDWLIHGGQNELDGYESTKRILALANRPNAIIFGTDYAAKGGLHALLEEGMRVPKDMAVVGMGNVLRPMETPIQITTLDLKVVEEGRTAASVLKRLIDGDPDVPQCSTIRLELIVREST